MSKRDLKKYLKDLPKGDLEEQVLELYDRLKEVRVFYNFVFNPQEEKLLDQAKFKVSKEYFPPSNRKPKRRRSVAQKHIRLFLKLGVEPRLIADLMLYHIEIGLAYRAENRINQEAFYKSMLKGFKEAIIFIDTSGIETDFNQRIEKISDEALKQNWPNCIQFENLTEYR